MLRIGGDENNASFLERGLNFQTVSACPLANPDLASMRLKFAEPIPAAVANGIRISMDGKGAWRDNVFVECIWKGFSTRRSA